MLGMTFVIALAWLVRLYNLGAQSLWNDEGTSIALARLSLPAIISGAAHDIHPPLYYLLLHFWLGVAGDSEFAARALSAAAGVALVAVTARLARELLGYRTGLFAAALSALSALQVYYAQETRMYIWVTLWGALSVWALVRFLRAAARGRIALAPLAGWVIASLAALYSHYFAPTLLLAQGIAAAVWLLHSWRRNPAHNPNRLVPIMAWLAGGAAIILLAFLPWLVYAGNQLSSWPAISDRLTLPDLTWRVLSAFVLGIDTPATGQIWVVALSGVLFVVGLVTLLRYPFPVTLCALWAFIPVLIMYAVSLQRPAYNPKFLLLATPGFLIVIAQGLSLLLDLPFTGRDKRRRLARALFFIAIAGLGLVGTGNALQGVYGDPRLQRDDYRGVLAYINQYARESDAVLVDAPGQIDVVRYYYHGAAPLITLPVGRPVARAATDPVLNDLIASRDNIFAVYWATEQADPEHYIERRLAEQRYLATDEWHGNIRLAQYGDESSRMTALLSAPVRFGEEIELTGAAQTGKARLQPGRILSLQFTWRAIATPSANYKVFVHLLDANGAIVAQRDAEPVAGFRPTSSWHAGDSITDHVGLLIRPGTPPGNYSVELGLYRADSSQRLALSSGGDHLVLGEVQIVAGQ